MYYGRQQLQFYINPIRCNFFYKLTVSIFSIICKHYHNSKQFSCKLKKFNKKPMKLFSLNNTKHLLKFCTRLKAMDYKDLWDSSLGTDRKSKSGLDKLLMNTHKTGMSNCKHVAVDRAIYVTSSTFSLKLVWRQMMDIFWHFWMLYVTVTELTWTV